MLVLGSIMYFIARAQPGRGNNQVKVKKTDEQFYFLADFVHTTPSKYYCNTNIPSQISDFVTF